MAGRKVTRTVLIVLVLAAVAALGHFYRSIGGRDHRQLTFSGYIEATEVRVAFEAAGRVEHVAVAEGERVKPGTVLARLDASTARLQLAQAEAALKAAEARLAEARAGSREQQIRAAEAAVKQAEAAEKQAEVALAAAERELRRLEELHAQGAVPQQQVDTARDARDGAAEQLAARQAATEAARANLDLIRAGTTGETIRSLEAAVAQARAARDLAQLNLDRTVLRAPVEGTVTGRLVEQGETVAQGTPAFTISRLDDLWVRIFVPEPDIGRVRLDQRAAIAVDSFPDKEFSGRVVHIAAEAEFTPRNVQTPEGRAETVFAVRVAVEEGAGLLKPGMPADVRLEE
ncbi:MAG: efflux RND transporter periplasmic adaptor subunit [Clostridia bacterium]|nr:efflux RND transporter periplasmic adaptor subunit [Clostridia bacterium]